VRLLKTNCRLVQAARPEAAIRNRVLPGVSKSAHDSKAARASSQSGASHYVRWAPSFRWPGDTLCLGRDWLASKCSPSRCTAPIHLACRARLLDRRAQPVVLRPLSVPLRIIRSELNHGTARSLLRRLIVPMSRMNQPAGLLSISGATSFVTLWSREPIAGCGDLTERMSSAHPACRPSTRDSRVRAAAPDRAGYLPRSVPRVPQFEMS
jgi:hypothetical protein